MAIARPLRSVLYIPGSKPRALDKARGLPVDAIIFDLEDAVSVDEKEAARTTLAEALAIAGASRKGALSVTVTEGIEGLDIAVTGGKPLDGPLRIVLARLCEAHRLARLA